MMEYKGYTGIVEFDDELGIFHGEVINTLDVITFQGTQVDELRQAFHDSVDDYIAFCQERGEIPEKPFSGKLLLRTSPENHRRYAIAAKKERTSLNAWASGVLDRATRS